MAVRNKVQLITYPDSLGGDLKSLGKLLDNQLKDVFSGGIHVLPPFPSSGDRGFAPLTYLEIDEAFGSWDDIRNIGKNHDVLVDLMVNHISQRSKYFQDYLEKGEGSEYADLFITLDKVWSDNKPNFQDVNLMFLRRETPWSTFKVGKTKDTVSVWTTFGKTEPSEQIDLDINSAATKSLLTEFFENFALNGVKIVRLDAVGYVIKKPGTSCFFVEPEIFDFLNWIKNMADTLGIELLPEIHSHHSVQFKLAERGFWIYDFILPYRILEALISGSANELCSYLRARPAKQFTMLDCHDGIPVKPDLDGLVSSEDASKLVQVCVERGANLSRVVSERHKSEDGFDVHQIRGSFYSLLGCSDQHYLTARALQFFAPGIPQVYYVGLLAGENDVAAVQATGEGREINRHNYNDAEIEEALQKAVVQRLIKLIHFRNEHPAFDGEFEVLQAEVGFVHLLWTKGEHYCRLLSELSTGISKIKYSDANGDESVFSV